MAIYRGHFPEISDEELVITSLLGDLEAFDELVRRFRGAVITVAEQVVRSHEIAEDVAQESLLLAFKALPQLEDPAHFAGWLYAITRHRAQRVAAREQRSEASEPSDLDRLIMANSMELGITAEPQPAEAFARKVHHDSINTTLNQLPPDYQIVLRLRYFQEWPLDRIADFLLLPLSTVKWRLHYGRKLMRSHLKTVMSEPVEEQTEAAQHGTKSNKRNRHSAHSTPAQRDREDCQRVQSHRQSQRRRTQLCPAI